MKKIIIIIVVLVLCFCLKNYFKHDYLNEEESDKDRISRAIAKRGGKEISEKYGMKFIGVGEASTKEGIWQLGLSFQSIDSFLTEEKARKLVTKCSNEYLEIINNDEDIRPFLQQYPFVFKNIEIQIFNGNKDETSVLLPYICIVTSSEGKISFYTRDSPELGHLHCDKSETYEEALAILEKDSA